MKRNYYDPEMKISAFSQENVVTGSGYDPVPGRSGSVSDYNGAKARAVLDFSDFADLTF